jgi:hypothetical protein
MTSPICIGCGCDEEHACPIPCDGVPYPGCFWLHFDAKANAGLCSACGDLAHVWKAGKRTPQLELIADRYYRQVLFLYDDAAPAQGWMILQQAALQGSSPRELILAGQLDRVQAMVDGIRSGAFE